MKNFIGKNAVITGAASGIGRSLALQLANMGCNIAISDIRKKELSETKQLLSNKNVKVISHYLDVADREAVFAYADTVEKELGKADLVINNAGAIIVDNMETIAYQDLKWQMDVCFWGVVNGTQAFLPHLKAKGKGHIANFSSIYGIVPALSVGAYNCAKYAVRGYTEALSLEFRNTDINFTVIHPGGINTNFLNFSKFVTHADKRVDHEGIIYMFNKLRFITSSKKAAKIIISAIKRNKRRVLVGKDAVQGDWLARLFPGKFLEGVVNSMEKKHAAKYVEYKQSKVEKK